MRKALTVATAVGFLLTLQAGFALAREPRASEGPQGLGALPVAPVELRAGHSPVQPRPIMPSALRTGGGLSTTATANIQVTYDSDFPPAARTAFEAAAAIWESRIVSSRTIQVDASWEPLGPGVLGGARPTYVWPHPDNRWYPQPLSEAICGCSRGPVDIEAVFNSSFADWYMPTDGNPPASKYDFFTVVLHELGHGLGFVSSFEIINGRGVWGYGNPARPMRYDEHEWSSATGGNRLINTAKYPNNSEKLRNQLIDGSVYFGGPNVVAANGGRARLFAPAPWQPGSSNAHFDESYFETGDENALMTPFLSNGEVIHEPGPVTLALFRDIGWQTSQGSTDTTPPTVSAPRTSFSTPQTIGSTVAVEVSWDAAQDTSGISGYTLQRKRNSGAWTNVPLGAPTDTSVVVALAPANTYRFRVAATDNAGNTSGFSANTAAKLVRPQEDAASVSYSGSWTRVASSGASGGFVRHSSAAGGTATFTFSGRSVGFVSSLGPNRGIAELRLDGVLVATVDLYAATHSAARLVWADNVGSGAHTLQVRVSSGPNSSSSGNRVDVDAFVAWK